MGLKSRENIQFCRRGIRRVSSAACYALILIASLSLSSCKPAATVKIGFAASLSGKDYLLGVDGRNAAELFVKELNARGGINGLPMELIIKDFTSDLGTIKGIDEELARQGVLAIVGHFTSNEVEAALETINSLKVPLVSPAATSETLSDKDDFFFRTIMSSKQDPYYLAEHMKSNGLNRLLIISTTLNKPYVETYTKAMNEKTTVVGEIQYQNITAIDYNAIKKLQPYDATLIIANSIDSGTIAQALMARGLDTPLYVSGWAGNEDLIQYGGKAVNRAVFVHQIDENLGAVQAFAEKYRQAYNQNPGFGAIETWDAMLYISASLEKSKPTRNSLYASLKAIRSLEGISGTIRFNETGDAKRAIVFKQIQDGKIVVLETRP